jgi:hypothetical protein
METTSKYFVSTKLNISLPRWFKYALGKNRVITIIEVHFVPKLIEEENDFLKALMINKELKNISVHCPELALMNTEYNNSNKGEEHTFICYTNSRINKKIELTSAAVDELNFELYGEEKISEEKIKTLRIELLLELLFPSASYHSKLCCHIHSMRSCQEIDVVI